MPFTEFQIKLYKKIREHRFLLKTVLKILSFLNFNKYNVNGSKNLIINEGVLLKKVKFDITGDHNQIYFHEDSFIENVTFFFRGSNHHLSIGNHCIIKGGSFWFEDDNCTINIGNNTTIENAHLAVTENEKSIEIGYDCMLAYDIEIRTGDSHSIIDLNSNTRINYARNVKILDHVWIGADVKILKGVTIGKNSIIGTGSIVNKSIPDNCIAAGIPAKVVRNNVTWNRQRI